MAEIKIGFIGLGIMGESMCENILKKGFPVWLYDINPKQIEKLVKFGGIPCNSLPDIAKNSTHIIIMVPTSENVREVIEGLIPHLKKGTIIIDMSTISPTTSKKLAEMVKEKDCHMFDCPVVKSKAAAISGDLGIYIGGDYELVDNIKSILECMGKQVIYFGPNGNGLIMKLCHNMLVGEIQNGVNEMLIMAQTAGLDIDAVIKGIKAGGGQNFYLDAKGDSIKKKDFSPKFSFLNMHKDMNLAIELAAQLKLNLPGAKMVSEVYNTGVNLFRNEDFSASIKVVEKLVKK